MKNHHTEPTGRPRGRPKGTTVANGAKRGVPGGRLDPKMKQIAIRNVLEPDELRFCQAFLAFGERDKAEAYRRSFLRKNHKGDWVDLHRETMPTPEELRTARVIPAVEVTKRAEKLLRQQHIHETIQELKRSPADHARQTLVDNILFGTSSEKKEAIKQIFADEDKLGFKDASEKWAEIMVNAGAEVVIPLGVIHRTLNCAECGHSAEIEVDLAVEVPLSGIFPTDAELPAFDPN